MIDDKLSVSELMTTSLIALPPVVPVRRLVDTLRMCNHQVGACPPAQPPACLPECCVPQCRLPACLQWLAKKQPADRAEAAGVHVGWSWLLNCLLRPLPTRTARCRPFQ